MSEVTTYYSTGSITMLNTLGQNGVFGNCTTWVYIPAEDRWEAQQTPGAFGVNLQSYGTVSVNQLELHDNNNDGLVIDNTNIKYPRF